MSGQDWQAPAEITLWREPGPCDGCGMLHDGSCPWPVTAPPPGLMGDDGQITPLGMLAEDALCCLIGLGWWDPGEDEQCPNWLLAGLAAAAAGDPCGPLCPTSADGALDAGAVSEHFLLGVERDWKRTWPIWACDCGRQYKVYPAAGVLDLYLPDEDGLPGEPAGRVQLDHAHAAVRRSDDCPGCGRRYASTMTDQARPQQVLFAEHGATPPPAARRPPAPRARAAAGPAAQPELF